MFSARRNFCRHKAAVLLQNSWRCYKHRRMIAINKAVITLQKALRTAKERHLFVEKKKAVGVIQRGDLSFHLFIITGDLIKCFPTSQNT